MHKDTLQQSIAAGHWAFANTVAQRVFALVTFLILARILAPEDFGIIALIAIVPTFLDGMTAFAFDTAALQKGNMERYLNTIWTFNITRTLLIFGAVFFGAPYIAEFYHIPDATLAMRFAALGILIQGFGNIGQALFFRDLDFKSIFIRDMLNKGSYAIAAIALALYLESYWALFWAGIVASTIGTISTYILHPYRPILNFKFNILGELRSFSQWFYGQSFVRQMSVTIQDSVIGRFTSPAALGLFSKAQALSDAPISPLVNIVNKVSFTSFVRVQNSPAHIVEGVYKMIDVIATIAIPYMFAVLLAGTALIHFILGDAWLGMAPILTVLVIEATLDIFATLSPAVFNAVGFARTQFLNSGVRALTLAILMIIFVPIFGIIGAAYAALASVAITACFVLYHLVTKLNVKLFRVFQSVAVVAIACLVPLPFASYALMQPFFNTLLGFLILCGVGAVAYFGIISIIGRLFDKGPYKTIELLVHSYLNSIHITFFNPFFKYHE